MTECRRCHEEFVDDSRWGLAEYCGGCDEAIRGGGDIWDFYGACAKVVGFLWFGGLVAIPDASPASRVALSDFYPPLGLIVAGILATRSYRLWTKSQFVMRLTMVVLLGLFGLLLDFLRRLFDV